MKPSPSTFALLLLFPFAALAEKHLSPGALEPVPHALGEQRVAVLVADFPGMPVSTPVSGIRDIFFSKSNSSLDSYLRGASYGKSRVTGDVYGPYQLDRNCGWENEAWNAAAAATVKLA
mgnify:CR=1 FL=1